MKNLRKTTALVLSAVLFFSICSMNISFASDECTHPYTRASEAREATCASEGVVPGKYCLFCNAVIVPDKATSRKEHNFVYSYTVKPDCTHSGYDVYECSVCHEQKNENYVSQLSPQAGSSLKESFAGSCTIGAYEKYNCLNCSGSAYVSTGSAGSGHSFVKGVCTRCNVSSDWQYYFSESAQGIVISGYTADADNVAVPSTIEGLPVVGIDGGVFDGKKMTALALPDTLTSLGAIRNCKKLKSLKIPEKVSEIVDSAFEGCTGLVSVSLPEKLRLIGNYAFSGCTSLETINVPPVEEYIGTSVFSDCTGLKKATIELLPEKTGGNLFAFCTSLEDVTLSVYQEIIPDGMFLGASSLKEIELPVFLKEIGANAFSGTDLEQVEFPRYLEKIGSSAFSESGLKEITIPGTVKEIGLQTFYKCNSLKKVVLSEGVESIGQNAFRFCCSLSELSLSPTLKTIGFWAFYGTAVKKLTIPDSVEYIDAFAFSDCDSLTSVDFGKSSAELEHYAFYRSCNLTDVTISPSMKKISEVAFLETPYGTAVEDDTTENPPAQAPENNVTDKEILDAIPDTVSLSVSASSIVAAAPAGSVVVDGNGKTLAAGELVGTGMKLIIKDGNRIIGEKIIVVPFDVDGDAKLSAADARLALRESVGLEAFADCQKAAADVDERSAGMEITAADARAILRASVGLEDADKWIEENIR